MVTADDAATRRPHDTPVDLVVQGIDVGTPELKELAKLTGAAGIVALDRAATQAFRLLLPTECAASTPFCEGAGLIAASFHATRPSGACSWSRWTWIRP
jgi:hypothetical protein